MDHKDGLLGDYDYKYLFTPDIPFITKELKNSTIFGVDSDMPILLGAILGFHACHVSWDCYCTDYGCLYGQFIS